MEIITNYLTPALLLAVIIWQFIQQIRSGNSSLVQKMLADYKERNNQLEGIIKNEREASEEFKAEMTKVVSDYKVEITRLQASNDAKDAHNKDLRELLQDKNPEVIAVLKEIRDFMKTTNEQNSTVLAYQTEILEEWKERSDKVDEASKMHRGDIMRVPT